MLRLLPTQHLVSAGAWQKAVQCVIDRTQPGRCMIPDRNHIIFYDAVVDLSLGHVKEEARAVGLTLQCDNKTKSVPQHHRSLRIKGLLGTERTGKEGPFSGMMHHFNTLGCSAVTQHWGSGGEINDTSYPGGVSH